ncbi:MAG: DNA helicase UvrD [Deltaproteobacteria bacterium]|nr:MAG: DNA helicase UvrD [Deltaproteobacteria bacterium]
MSDVVKACSPPDADVRRRAIDPGYSFIVQAPAGSGKTELLSQRLLRLLAVVDRPEEILAITFTRKAAEEMKGRVLGALKTAQAGIGRTALDPHVRFTLELADKVLERDRTLGWKLLENPSRLRLQTIDSFCAYLVRRMPWVSRFGGQMAISEQPEDLYRSAAELLLARTEEEGPVGDAVVLLLDHLDNRLGQVRDMLVGMLARRDQWIPYVLEARTQDVRLRLQANLAHCCQLLLDQLESALAAHRRELLDLARYAAANLAEGGNTDLADALADLGPDADIEARVRAWDLLVGLLCTAKGDLRKTVTVNQGFPAGREGREIKGRMTALLASLAGNDEIVAAIGDYRNRPGLGYPDADWRILQALLDLLPAAVAELRRVFADRGEVDYVEVAGAALLALGDDEAPEELLLQLDAGLKHILVDEFQDTSILQYRLLQRLTSGWRPGDGRSLFLVGDPMQSIYRFRQAEVSLFLMACRQGLGQVPLEPLNLSANFRSQAGIVDWVNQVFAQAFPSSNDVLHGAVAFSPACATRPADPQPAVQVRLQVSDDDQAASEGEAIADLIAGLQREHPDWSIAVLARARKHLQPLVRQLASRGIPFQGQDLDTLSDRQAILDLHSLTRALLHPADRISWLAVLRAPWCGLTLADLDNLIRGDRNSTLLELLEQGDSQAELFDRLSVDGRARWQRIRPALAKALGCRGRVPLRRLVESTWLALGGPACISETELPDAERYFALLEEIECAGDLEDFAQLEARLQQLYAGPGPATGSQLQLMTVHKAKGLEFDAVILPGLHRKVTGIDRPLLNWLDHPEVGLMLAGLRRADSDANDPTYDAIQAIETERDRQETTRLMYVAATRAKQRLYLFGQVRADEDDNIRPPSESSLLGRIWQAVQGQAILVAEEKQTSVTAHPAGLLVRLPVDWRLPELADSLDTSLPVSLSPSRARDEMAGMPKRQVSLRAGEGRLVGTLVHALLERLGTCAPSRKELEAELPHWQAWLVQNGLPWHRREAVANRVLAAMVNVCNGRHWDVLFGRAADVRVEWGLNGLVDGQLQHAVIDRSFVDPSGLRWVVDFKTSAPGRGEPVEDFLAAERDRYRSQLDLYAKLAQLYDDSRPVRAALYFPMIDRLDIL